MSRTIIPTEALDHGDHRRYHRGCHCTLCTAAACAQASKWKYLRATGRGSFVSAKPAVAHIWALRMAGLPDRLIAQRAGVGEAHLHQVLIAKKIRYYTAAKILAVPVPEATSTRNGAFIPNVGTIRRLRALSADGWPTPWLDSRLKTGEGYVAYLMRQELGRTIRLFTAVAVKDACAELAGQEPESFGVLHRSAKAVRAKAAAKGWAGTAYWDAEDFDDPDFQPALDDGNRRALAAARRADIEHLAAFAIPPHEIAARLDMSADYVHDKIRDMRKAA
ncbi:hypothetical protein [Streptomyces sp. cmx-4-9]|uniref:hypothetical protein n=1 Tax=Streptomyces sp. cmx-4-9 TaxID=2790941 RepID=UPI0039809FA7